MKVKRVGKIWVKISTSKIDLFQFKMKVSCKNEDFDYLYIRTHYKKDSHPKCQKLHSPFFLLSEDMLKWMARAEWSSWMLWNWWNIRLRFKIVYFNIKKRQKKELVTLKYVANAQPIPLSLISFSEPFQIGHSLSLTVNRHKYCKLWLDLIWPCLIGFSRAAFSVQ